MDLYTTFDPRLRPIHEDDFRRWSDPHNAPVLNDIAEIPESGEPSPMKAPDNLDKIYDQKPKRKKDKYPEPSSATTPEPDSFKMLFLSHWFEVCVYCIVFLSFGMSVAFLGPTILDLGCQTTTDLKHMSWVFFIQLFMTLVGSISAGFLVHVISANALLIFTTLGVSMMYFLLPSCMTTSTLLICLGAMGWFMGNVDCIANLQMLKLYGSKVTPFLQMMYFCYGLGAFLSPMISEPFLLNNDCTKYIDGYEKMYKIEDLQEKANVSLEYWNMPSTVNISVHGDLVNMDIVNVTGPPWQTTLAPDEIAVKVPPDLYMLYRSKMKTDVRYTFYILGAIQLPIPFIVLFLYVRLKRHAHPYTIHESQVANESGGYGTLSTSTDENKEDENASCCSKCGAFKSREIFLICILSGGMLFFFDGIESSYGGFIYTYSIETIGHMDKSEGATINACYWGLFAFGRLLSVFLSTRLTSAFMLLGNIIGCGATVMLLLIFNDSHIAIYFGTCLIGLFLSSCSPSVFALCEQYLDVESSITSFLVVSAAFGEMVFPLIVGNLFVDFGPLSLFVFCLVVLSCNLFLYTLLRGFGSRTAKWKETGHPSFIWLNGYEDPSPDERLVIKPNSSTPYVRMTDNNRNQATYEMERVQPEYGDLETLR